jgi:hypothetical protein
MLLFISAQFAMAVCAVPLIASFLHGVAAEELHAVHWWCRRNLHLKHSIDMHRCLPRLLLCQVSTASQPVCGLLCTAPLAPKVAMAGRRRSTHTRLCCCSTARTTLWCCMTWRCSSVVTTALLSRWASKRWRKRVSAVDATLMLQCRAVQQPSVCVNDHAVCSSPGVFSVYAFSCPV